MSSMNQRRQLFHCSLQMQCLLCHTRSATILLTFNCLILTQDNKKEKNYSYLNLEHEITFDKSVLQFIVNYCHALTTESHCVSINDKHLSNNVLLSVLSGNIVAG